MKNQTRRVLDKYHKVVHVSSIYIYWLLGGIGLKILTLGLKLRSSTQSEMLSTLFFMV